MATGDKVYIADKPTLDSVDNKVGLNTNIAGTTTVFARLRQIYEYLTTNLSTTRTALLDRLDGTISSRQANWGAVAGTKTNIDNTWTRVNTNLDKKISEVGGINIRNVYSALGQTNTHSATTVLNVNGSGYLICQGSSQSSVMIQIDNGTIFTSSTTIGLLRFNSNLRVTSNNTLVNIFYSLD